MFNRIRFLSTLGLITLAAVQVADGQRIRLPSSSSIPATTAGQTNQVVNQGGAAAPTLTQGAAAPFSGSSTTRLTPVVQPSNQSSFSLPTQVNPGQVQGVPQTNITLPTGTVPNASIQSPTFDAFSTQGQVGPPPVVAAPNGNFSTVPGGQPNQIYPPANAQPVYIPGQVAPGATGQAAAPNSLYPGWQPSGIAWPQAPVFQGQYMRLFSDRRFEMTWVNGDNGADVDMVDLLMSTTMNYPDFLGSTQPIHITPAFIFHWWNGPSPPVTVADLPSRAYSAYLDFAWSTRQDVQFGADIDFRVGIYSDFNSITSRAFRFTGTGLGWLRITPNLTFKAGIEYLDRVDKQMFPAIGLFWKPNPDVNLELYFPRPKFERRLPQMGNTDVWFYAGAEYGGGSWVVERTDLSSDQIDINDIRIFGGFRWMTLRKVTGFFEAGYVFDRKLVYRSATPTIGLKDTFMLRAGFSF